MSKQADKKQKIVSPRQEPQPSYYQSYIPSTYVPNQQNVSHQFIQGQYPNYGTTVIQADPIVLPSIKKVVQGETITMNSHERSNCCCQPCTSSGSQVVTRQMILRPTQTTTDYPKKLDEIEKLHLQEIRDIEQRMQNQLDQFVNQRNSDDQTRQLSELKQTVFDLKSQLSQSRVSQYVQQPSPVFAQSQPNGYQIDKIEKELSKKKNKIKNLKIHLDSLKQELFQKNQILNEYEIRLQHNESAFRMPPKIHLPEQQDLLPQIRMLERERENILNDLRNTKGECESLKQALFQTDTEKLRREQDWNRMVNDFKGVEQENTKLNTILYQKDELIRSLEQRLSIELSRQSLFMAQQSPQRILVEQTSRPVQTHYIVDSQQQQPQYIVTENRQQIQTVQPTLVQTLPNVKIQQQ